MNVQLIGLALVLGAISAISPGPLLALATTLLVGTLGYVLIEGWSLADAAYMTVTTVATVGYGELHPLSHAGRLFTIALILLGVGSIFYAFGAVMTFVFEGHLTRSWGLRRMERRVQQLSGHHILCGYGRVGRQIARDLRRERVPFVVIDVNQSSLDQAAAEGLTIVYGNVARANYDDAVHKLRRAGATHVVSPYAMAGQQMALLAVRPAAVDFVETLLRGAGGDFLLEDLRIAETSELVGISVTAARRQFASGATLLALRRDGRMLAPPPVDTTLRADDIIVVAGTDGQLRLVERACGGAARAEAR